MNYYFDSIYFGVRNVFRAYFRVNNRRIARFGVQKPRFHEFSHFFQRKLAKIIEFNSILDVFFIEKQKSYSLVITGVIRQYYAGNKKFYLQSNKQVSVVLDGEVGYSWQKAGNTQTGFY